MYSYHTTDNVSQTRFKGKQHVTTNYNSNCVMWLPASDSLEPQASDKCLGFTLFIPQTISKASRLRLASKAKAQTEQTGLQVMENLSFPLQSTRPTGSVERGAEMQSGQQWRISRDVK